MKSWYTIRAQADDSSTGNIDIFDEIGLWGIRAKDFIRELENLGAVTTINLRINSKGGDVIDGLAIYNALKQHKARVIVTVYGIAASIASVVAMAGDSVRMPENTFLFVHNPSGLADVFAFADAEKMRELADDLRAFADVLDKMKFALVRSYASKSGQEDDKIAELMDGETWLTAAEAKELNFADEVLEPAKLAARADLSRFKNLPESVRQAFNLSEDEADRIREMRDKLTECVEEMNSLMGEEAEDRARASAAPAAPSEARPQAGALTADDVRAAALEINEACKKADVVELAGDFLAGGLTPDQVRERLKDAGAIRAACTGARPPERAARYIKAGMSLSEVRADLFEILQSRDEHIDNRLPVQERTPEAVVLIDTKEIYARRRRAA